MYKLVRIVTQSCNYLPRIQIINYLKHYSVKMLDSGCM